ncbi:MAG: D-2-hydroxyacid dehydrogenase [Deltaproteobacteria bacterium]|jgi:phosphoglycerate dehydrogenase-like enzyme|nr:D-2-hydroxyacid dehydrogenase [Deltaproteobacteria bacterium]MBW2533833.1 D-2-hydroxyacid dehydrogenase [Deltaproteobacteria bacterium]
MTTGPRTIFCDTSFPDEAARRLERGLARHDLLLSDRLQTSNLVPSPPDPKIGRAEIAFGQPDPQSVLASRETVWVHLTSAGFGRYDDDAFRRAAAERGFRLTTSSSVYAAPCAEHALAMILSSARQLPSCHDDQRTRAWHPATRRRQSFLLRGQRILLLGFGAIAQQLAKLLAPFEAEVVALRRTPRGDESIRTIAVDDLDEALAGADHVVDLLPGTAETEGLVDEKRFAAMASRAYFYNLGRGSTVDQAALVDALRRGAIAGAFLDVTDPEPPPPDDPIWTAPNCYLTPHSAGGRDTEHLALVEHFLANLDRFERGEPLADRVL